ncbi:MAG: metallophosphoesterase [Meiothermus silvanus]|nr:metallophosphoesterase [Allomeiothermus silvanus]
MRVFAIADPHLSRAFPKPMDIFGGNWEGHPEAFFSGWREMVGPEDLVIIAGDISWAMRLEDALLDLQDIAKLPGTKVLLRGNHDYWWGSIGRVRSALPNSMYALQNDSLVIGDVAIAGTRGWDVPGSRELTPEDAKIYRREVERLRLSLESLKGKPYGYLVLALHYPPFGPGGEKSAFTDLIEQYRPDAVLYGHLHGADGRRLPQDWKGIPLHFVAADYLQFKPKLIFDTSLRNDSPEE